MEFYFCPPAVFVCWLHLFVGFPVIIVPLRLVEPLSTSPCCYLLMPWRTRSLKYPIWPILVFFCPPAVFVCWLHLFVRFLVVIDPLSTSPCSNSLMLWRTKNLRHPLSTSTLPHSSDNPLMCPCCPAWGEGAPVKWIWKPPINDHQQQRRAKSGMQQCEGDFQGRKKGVLRAPI